LAQPYLAAPFAAQAPTACPIVGLDSRGGGIWDLQANAPPAARPGLSTPRDSSYKMAVLEFLAFW
jgi:hypothetical protein